MRNEAALFTQKFAKLLKEKRLALGLSHDKLAEKTGITRPAISAIESFKRTPTIATCYKLSNALGIPLSEMIGEVEKL